MAGSLAKTFSSSFLKPAFWGQKGGFKGLKQACFYGYRCYYKLLLRSDPKPRRSAAEDHAIFAMWAIFERRIISTLVQESEKMVDSPSSAFNKTVHKKVVDSIEYWRTDDLLDLIRPLVGGELAGQAKQIKRHRDWLAHKNPRKPSPGNVPPASAFKVLSEIARLLTSRHPQSTDVPIASDFDPSFCS